MRFVLFYHSLVSDWNHGNAHFLRGVVAELVRCGHDVRVLEPAGGWSCSNLLADHGIAPLRWFRHTYPGLRSEFYAPATLDVGRVLESADVVLVHEWTDHGLVARIGRHRRAHAGYVLLFHDTHHRAATDPSTLPLGALEDFDGVLAFGRALRDLYLSNDWTERAWIWHEAADHRRFRPMPGPVGGDVVWIGNWGDGERTEELQEFLIDPVRKLGLSARVHGVRYPPEGRAALETAGIEYAGWLPNFAVPAALARHRATIHVPRRPYVEALPGIPTIRMFEALACGIPLVCARWRDTEGLFTEGADYLLARDGREMTAHLERLLHDPEAAEALAAHGRRTIETRHTCMHRVLELVHLLQALRAERSSFAEQGITTAATATRTAAGAGGGRPT